MSSSPAPSNRDAHVAARKQGSRLVGQGKAPDKIPASESAAQMQKLAASTEAAERELLVACNALYIATDAAVADDVKQKARAVIEAHTAFNQALAAKGRSMTAASPRSTTDIVSAADDLFEFLWNEKETHEPPRELLDEGWVACESSADYEKEERLTIALGRALGKEIE